MLLSLLLLLLLVCSAQASHFYGTVITYYPKNTNITAGPVEVVLRYKLNFHSCSSSDTWTCLSGNCGSHSTVLNKVYEESSGEWCQREGIMTRQVLTTAPFQLRLSGGNWINNVVNGIISWRAVTLVELRERSDTGQANRSPQTTIIPAVRVPSNCPRDFSLLAFDPDGDEVKCRYGLLSECNPCTAPSVLNLSSSCTLSFSPTSSSNEGAYVVQLVMEDFPRSNITLTLTNGQQQMNPTNDAISKLPVQFVVRVDPVVPSCTEGLYLPKFLPPTPAHRARLYTSVNQTVEININAETNFTTISELLFSGPYNINQNTTGVGQFILRWTPSDKENGESHPICFVVQAVSINRKYHSELRCVIVTVGNATITPNTTTTTVAPTIVTTPNLTTAVLPPTVTTPGTTLLSTEVTEVLNSFVLGVKMRISASSDLSDEYLRTTFLQLVKNELQRQGVPSIFTLRLVSSTRLNSTTTATSAGPIR